LKVRFFGWKEIGEKENRKENSLMKGKKCIRYEIGFYLLIIKNKTVKEVK